MNEFINIDDVGKVFAKLEPIRNAKLREDIKSYIQLNDHWAKNKIIHHIDRRRIQFVESIKPLPMLFYLERDGIVKVNIYDLNSNNAYTILYGATILSTIHDKRRHIPLFFIPVAKVFLTIFYNLFGKKYGIRMFSKENVHRFVYVTFLTVARKLFMPYMDRSKIVDKIERQKIVEYTDKTKIPNASQFDTWRGYIDYISTELPLYGLSYTTFKKIVYLKLGIFLLCTFEHVYYAISMFPCLNIKSGGLLPKIKYMNPKLFELLDVQLVKTLL